MASGKILDLLIIGGGHNGLVCAFYAARAGLSVRVIEKNDIVGGAAITEEFHAGFRNSVAAYTVSLLNPKIIADMQLARHGLRIVKRKALNFLPLPDGGHLLNGPGRTQATIADRNEKDGRAYPAYAAELDRVSDILRELVLVRPPNLVEGGLHRVLPELLRTAGLGRRLARLDAFGRQNFLDLLTRSAGDYLDGWFEDEAVKALLGFDAIVGNFASPFQPGSAYVLLHHVFGDVDGERGLWGHAIGGMGAITQAMAKAAGGAGAAIETGVAVEKVLIDGTRAVGVRLPHRVELIDRQAVHPVVVGVHDDAQAVVGDLELDVLDVRVGADRHLFVLDRAGSVRDVGLARTELLEPSAGARGPDGDLHARVLRVEVLGRGFAEWRHRARSVDGDRAGQVGPPVGRGARAAVIIVAACRKHEREHGHERQQSEERGNSSGHGAWSSSERFAGGRRSRSTRHGRR
ncbi:MAG: NAD(P)/FAD-dependent oxidoreductase [Cucumibacter sp.]